MPAYDYVIAGGGLAGLSLACHLVRSPLCGASILIVDRQPAAGARTWSYWTEAPTLFDPIVEHAWPQVRVAGPSHDATCPLPGCRYELIRGSTLDRFARRELALHANVSFWQGEVEGVEDGGRGARVCVSGQTVKAGWVFDSTNWPRPDELHAGRLTMHYFGWTVTTPQPGFDPQTVTFLDTRTAQRQALRFFYVLPFSERQALVEYVVYAPRRPARGEAHAALETYLRATLGLADFEVGAAEAGWLPMLPAHQPRRLGRHRLAIGAKAGLIKPTTGFGFQRIQQDSAAIVRSLLSSGQPWRVDGISRRHRLYDGLLLEVMRAQGDATQAIFDCLFARNPLGRVLRFLDESSTPAEDLALIGTLPPRLFLEALPRYAAGMAGARRARQRA